MLPKAGVFAHYQADVVAHNIAAEIKGSRSRKAFDGRGYCFVEMGYGKAGFDSGNFYTEPQPTVRLRKPGRLWHWGKILFEKWWLWRWF
ncbi:MAG: NAD(P)/FAD-dependent oxidoreductase, partial [Actinomycetota bacterium]